MGEVRIRKINKLILQQVGLIVEREIERRAPAMITVKKVDTTEDLLFTDIWISILPETQEAAVIAELDEQVGVIQRLLNRKLRMRFVPWLRFKIDQSEQKAADLHKLIRETRTADEAMTEAERREAEAVRLEEIEIAKNQEGGAGADAA